MAGKKEEIPVHEIIIKLLEPGHPKSRLRRRLIAFLELYSAGAIVPTKGVPDLIKAFQRTFDSLVGTKQLISKKIFDAVIQNLEKQLTEAEARKNTFKEVATTSGQIIEVNISLQACQKFGFVPGQRISHRGRKGVVVGVAPKPSRKESSDVLLWIALKENDGQIHFVNDPNIQLIK